MNRANLLPELLRLLRPFRGGCRFRGGWIQPAV